MSWYIRSTAASLVAVLSIAGVCANGCRAAGQEVGERIPERMTGERLVRPMVDSTTVSIAALRIPLKARQHFEKARTAAQHSRFEESERESAKALEIAPEFAEVYLLLASEEVRAHNYEQALKNVEAAKKAEPDVRWLVTILAGAYNGMHRYHDAHLILDALRGPEAESWQAEYERARAEIGCHDVEAGLRWSGMALALAPENFPDAHLLRSNALILAHRWSAAATQIETYLQSTEGQTPRFDVTNLLAETKQRARDEESADLASR